MAAMSTVAVAPLAVSTASPAAPAPAAAAALAAGTIVITAVSAYPRRRLAARGRWRPAPGWHRLHPGVEVGIDFHDPDARDVRRGRPGAARAATEARAAQRHPSGRRLL